MAGVTERETDVTGMTKKVISTDRNPVTGEIEDATESHWLWELPIFSSVIPLGSWMIRFTLPPVIFKELSCLSGNVPPSTIVIRFNGTSWLDYRPNQTFLLFFFSGWIAREWRWRSPPHMTHGNAIVKKTRHSWFTVDHNESCKQS